MTALLRASGIRRDFPGAGRVLGPVSLSVERRALIVVVGPSGGGKSTLLRCLAGLERPDGGTIEWQGAAGTVGVVFQEPRLMPWLDVARNVGFGLDLKRAARDARVREMLALVGLPDAGTRLPKQLSGGMAQRAALARSLATQPDLLLLDEPFSALDAPTRTRLQDHLRMLQSRTGATMVLVTHDLVEALRLGDRVLVLAGRPGRIIAEVTPASRDPSTAAFRAAHRRLGQWLKPSAPAGSAAIDEA